jgi:prohibitin 2
MTISQLIKIGIGTLVGIFLLCILLGASSTVPQGSVGIMLRFGQANKEVLAPGFHLKAPFADTIEYFPISTARFDTGNIGLKSKDSQEIQSNISVLYHVMADNCAVGLYTRTNGNPDQIPEISVKSQVYGATGAQFASYTIEELVTKRAELKNGLFNDIKNRLASSCIVVDDVNIVSFEFSDKYNQSIEAKVQMDQARLTAQLTLEKEKVSSEIRVVNAKADADAAIATAEGEAKSIKLKADADADAIKVKAQALNAAPANYVNYIAATNWDGQLPQVTSGVPFLNLPIQARQQPQQ